MRYLMKNAIGYSKIYLYKARLFCSLNYLTVHFNFQYLFTNEDQSVVIVIWLFFDNVNNLEFLRYSGKTGNVLIDLV